MGVWLYRMHVPWIWQKLQITPSAFFSSCQKKVAVDERVTCILKKGRKRSTKKIFTEPSPPPTPHVLVPKNTFTEVKFYWCNRQYLWHASATSERTFSALRWLKNYQRSTMKQDRLNNCPLMRCHTSITDTLDTLKIAFVNKQRKRYFGKFD